ncbi:hypothetical protein VN24_14840 [Paenibacillus beijingensis]|uniref:Uncharacterized protein n=1 Tax=Paenibacillus beijingensis TaxID=1126833 RepID=A0A0D5NKD6_9BACL|nr:hypothetical protein VN24_14840 [Paenibacillus beijingensis]
MIVFDQQSVASSRVLDDEIDACFYESADLTIVLFFSAFDKSFRLQESNACMFLYHSNKKLTRFFDLVSSPADFKIIFSDPCRYPIFHNVFFCILLKPVT